MCTILLHWDPAAAHPLVLAANRDELRDRPSDPPGPLAPGTFGGRDRRGGGTWLAVGREGLAAVTNVSGVAVRADAPSRGGLPLAALAGTLPDDLAPYNAFNLLLVDARGARVLTHDGGAAPARWRSLAPGAHAIVNEPYDGPPSSRRRNAERIAARRELDMTALGEHGDEARPGLCHHGARYGTVSATVVVLDAAWSVHRYLHAEGLPCRAAVRDYTRAARVATRGPVS